MAPAGENGYLSRVYIDYVYVPAALLIFGTLIVKKEWAPYSALLAVALGAYNFWNFRTLLESSPRILLRKSGQLLTLEIANCRGQEGPQA
jgi:NO-binding membrane sensor protein with MHYT domain